MREAIKDYLRHLGLRRKYSQHTVAAYARDLVEFEAFVRDYHGQDRARLCSVDRLAGPRPRLTASWLPLKAF